MNHPPRWGFITATPGKVLILQVRGTAGRHANLYSTLITAKLSLDAPSGLVGLPLGRRCH